ncbi:hypothetical protein [Methylobacterium sp. PvR107]|uniref:hypothetical protein n=1 Tax=Methylobacterium sp. PvR107 TaxID=2806597 RepID=UPI001AE9D7AF|nr:hypothetical protein [Methylobacterium sp. PvR107]MBP1183810.1 hypothetical protein [Methylobacterium sp. PvR107]
MSGSSNRRGFLRGLTTLPLIGGSVTLIGAPSAVAEPVTHELLDSYDAWLEYERRHLQWERHGNMDPPVRWNMPFLMQVKGVDRPCDYVPVANGGARFHGNNEGSALSRAALVLSTVGCEWKGSGL